jgi:hypothetical protein
VLFTKYYQDDKIKENEMGSTCMEEMRNAYKIWVGHLIGRDHLEVQHS